MNTSHDSPGFPSLPELDLGSDDQQVVFPLETPAAMQPAIAPNPFTAAEDAPPIMEAVPAPTVPAPQPIPQQAPAAPNPAAPATDSNPILSAFDQMEEAETQATRQSLFAKLPKFKFAGAEEDIEDGDITFEALRQLKSIDFPELEEKKTSWSVSYGKVSKMITDPKKAKVADIKREIETSKDFVDSLKKAKDKNPDCLVTPRVVAEKKGIMPAYKGIFPSFETAVVSGKLISLVPGRSGSVYEVRNNEMGIFITPTGGHAELSDVSAGFHPKLPAVPMELLEEIISFFRRMMFTQKGEMEALAHILWDQYAQQYVVNIPNQTVSKHSVDADTPDYNSAQFIHYISIHSHNSMKAYFSKTDDADEKATRVYAVVGRLHDYYPDIRVRISNGGNFLEINPRQVFNLEERAYPHEWEGSITFRNEAAA